jgi:TP901 family phage tail tape measure protein
VAVAVVDVQVRSSDAVKELQRVNNTSKQLNQTITDTNGRLRDANGRFIKFGEAAQQSSAKVGLLTNAVKNLASQLVVADIARRFFKGFDEADRAAAAVRTLGVDSKALQAQLLGVSNRLGGLYSQTQLVTAAYDVASSGFADAADAAKVLEAAAKGATGGLSDINTVGNAVTSVLNAYGKSANDAAMLVDGFIQTQNDGKIVLNEYAQQIGKLAPTAAATGVGIQELNAAIATITAQGVPVEATFTGLNQALVSILKPSKEASDLAKALGIDFSETGLRAKGFGGLLKEVKEKTGGSTTALVQLFGSVDALKAVLPLVNDDFVKYNKNVERQANVSGVADKATQELGGTVTSEITKMVNQIGNLARALDVVLGPALGGIVKLINVVIAEATRGINVLSQLFSLSKNTAIVKTAIESGDLRGAAAGRVIPGVDELIGQQRRKQLQRQAGAGTGFLGLGFDAAKFGELLKQQPEIKRLLGAAAPSGGGDKPSGAIDSSIQAILDRLDQKSGGSKGKSDAEKSADKAKREAERAAEAAKKEAERVAEVIRARIAETGLIRAKSELQDKIAAAEAARDPMLVARLQGQQRELDLQYQYAEQLVKETNEQAKKAIIFEQQTALVANQREVQRDLNELQARADQDRFNALQKHIEQQYELNTAAQNQLKLADGISNTLGQGIGGAFDALIAGSEAFGASLKRIASGVLIDIAKQLLQIFVIEQAINALKGVLTPFSAATPLGAGGGMVGKFGTLGPNFGIPQRAQGGSVMAGQPYLVGERGPELFMPGRSGGIARAGSFGGGANIVVNVDAGGTSVQGNQPEGQALGRAIAAAVQAELIKQKRPGGILA